MKFYARSRKIFLLIPPALVFLQLALVAHASQPERREPRHCSN